MPRSIPHQTASSPKGPCLHAHLEIGNDSSLYFLDNPLWIDCEALRRLCIFLAGRPPTPCTWSGCISTEYTTSSFDFHHAHPGRRAFLWVLSCVILDRLYVTGLQFGSQMDCLITHTSITTEMLVFLKLQVLLAYSIQLIYPWPCLITVSARSFLAPHLHFSE